MSHRASRLLASLFLCAAARAQGPLLSCATSSAPLTVHAEGVTERAGDILLSCSGGAPSESLTGNFTIFLNAGIANRLSANNATGVEIVFDNGPGPQLAPVTGYLNGPAVSFNGLSVPLSSTGTLTLRITNLRVNATDVQPGSSVTASLAINSANILPIDQSVFVVARPSPGLFTGFSDRLVCSQRGSPLPTNPASFAAFLAAGSAFASTRLTEGFASSFEPLSNAANFEADSGDRFLITYSGFPAGARLFAPTVVAGSDAFAPTAGGDLGAPASGGQYAPSSNGSLLLSIVQGANAAGAGGQLVYQPAAIGSPAVSFDSMTEIPLTNGTGTLVYEVVDANSFIQETAQFPTFLALPAGAATGFVETQESVTFAPVSSAPEASPTAPVPRFAAVTPAPDCSIVGDCGASYYPKASVIPVSMTFNAVAGGKLQSQYIHIGNAAGGVLNWTATIQYPTASPQNWLTVSPDLGIGATNTFAYFDPSQLAPGNYSATILISAGLIGGQAAIPVTAAISAPPTPPAPAIASAVNAANSKVTQLVAGSIASIYGANFAGAQLSVLFSNLPATVLYQGATQLNVVVPAALAGQTSAQLVVSVNGASSAPLAVTLAPLAPAVFPNGVLNQDSSLNTSRNPAALGSVIQMFLTGLGGAQVTATLASKPATLEYSGPAPGLDGVQQINVTLPGPQPDVVLPPGPQTLTLCGPSLEWFTSCTQSATVTVYVQ